MNEPAALRAMLRLDADLLRAAWWMPVALVVFGLIMSASRPQEPFVVSSLPFVVIASTMSLILPWNRDRHDGLDRLYGTLPMRRRDLVTARYLGTLLAQVGVVALLLLMAVVADALGRPGDLRSDVLGALGVGAGLVVFWAVTLPFLLRLGPAWAFLFGIAITAFLAVAGVYGALLVVGDGIELSATPTVMGVAWIVALVAYALSHSLAVRIREGQDL